MSDRASISVEASQTFRKNIRTLAKRYRSTKKDIQPIIQQLSQGELPGDQISGVGHAVYKLRVRNSDTQKGKSGGYRLIY